jgi:hypothetical protein
MSWHGFEADEVVTRDQVVAACEERIASDKVVAKAEKEIYVDILRSAPDHLVWSPQGSAGWGASPFNPNNWRTVGGSPSRVIRLTL